MSHHAKTKTINLSRRNLPSLVVVFLLFSLVAACSKKLAPIAEPPKMNVNFIPPSNLNLPVKISRYELNRAIRDILTNVFRDGLTVEDGYSVRITPEGETDIQASQNQILLTIPLNLEITPSMRIQQVKGYGTMELQLAATIDVLEDRFISKTELINHRWLKKPVLKVLGVSLPIETLANQLVKRYKNRITQALDAQIMQSVQLPKIRQSIQNYFREPFFTAEDGILKVYVAPVELAAGPFQMDSEHITLPVIIYLENVISEMRPAALSDQLGFSTRPFPDTSSVFSIQSRIPLAYLEQILREQLITQEFGAPLAHIRIENLVLSGTREIFEANFQTTGTLRGGFRLDFKPEFDQTEKKFYLREFHLKQVSGKGLSKALFSVLKSNVEKTTRTSIEDQLNQFLNEYLETARGFLNHKEIVNGIKLNGEIRNYFVRDFWIEEGRMYFTVSADLNLQAEVHYIDTRKFAR